MYSNYYEIYSISDFLFCLIMAIATVFLIIAMGVFILSLLDGKKSNSEEKTQLKNQNCKCCCCKKQKNCKCFCCEVNKK